MKKRILSTGNQNFENIRKNNYFYIDKTDFIKEWWDNSDIITLISRPRRFGKTLNISMTEHFFSNKYANRSDLFEGLSIWKYPAYQNIQGTYPVISVSFSSVKETNIQAAKKHIAYLISDLYNEHRYLVDSDKITDYEKSNFISIIEEKENLTDPAVKTAISKLCELLSRYYEKKVIILLDDYDAPIKEAYMHGYVNEFADFTRGLFNSTFKTNQYLERALIIGSTSADMEAFFSDLNLVRSTTVSKDYADCFGFTIAEMDTALTEYDLFHYKQEVHSRHGSFSFHEEAKYCNPWSVANFLKNGTIENSRANNVSVPMLIKRLLSVCNIHKYLEKLLSHKDVSIEMDEIIDYERPIEAGNEKLFWNLLLANGYVTCNMVTYSQKNNSIEYKLGVPNQEARIALESIITSWLNNNYTKPLHFSGQ